MASQQLRSARVMLCSGARGLCKRIAHAVPARLASFNVARAKLAGSRTGRAFLFYMTATAFSYPSAMTEPVPSLWNPLSRNASIGAAVVAFHVALIWALQSGLLLRAAELVIPASVIAVFIEPPTPVVEPTPPKAKTSPLPPAAKKTAAQPAKTPAKPTPQPLAVPDQTPSAHAPAGVLAPVEAVSRVQAVEPAAAAPAPMQQPSSDAAYLRNPSPPYPPLSKRLNEQGKVVIRVLIGVDGSAKKGEIGKSSGFDRLDQTALNTVLKWRYVPGQRGGTPEEMWFNVPINFVLE